MSEDEDIRSPETQAPEILSPGSLRSEGSRGPDAIVQNAFLSPSALAARRLGKRIIPPRALKPGGSFSDQSQGSRSTTTIRRDTENPGALEQVTSTTRVTVPRRERDLQLASSASSVEDLMVKANEATMSLIKSFSSDWGMDQGSQHESESVDDTDNEYQSDVNYFSSGGAMALSNPGKVEEKEIDGGSDDEKYEEKRQRGNDEDEIAALERQLQRLKREREMAKLEQEIAQMKKTMAKSKFTELNFKKAINADVESGLYPENTVDTELASSTPSGVEPVIVGYIPPSDNHEEEKEDLRGGCTDYIFCFGRYTEDTTKGLNTIGTIAPESSVDNSPDSMPTAFADTISLQEGDQIKTICPTIAEADEEDESVTVKDEVASTKDDLDYKEETGADVEEVGVFVTNKTGSFSALDGEAPTIDLSRFTRMAEEDNNTLVKGSFSNFFCWGNDYILEEPQDTVVAEHRDDTELALANIRDGLSLVGSNATASMVEKQSLDEMEIVRDDSKVKDDMPGLEDQPDNGPRSSSVPTNAVEQDEGAGEVREAEHSVVEDDSNHAIHDMAVPLVADDHIPASVATGIDNTPIVEIDAGTDSRPKDTVKQSSDYNESILVTIRNGLSLVSSRSTLGENVQASMGENQSLDEIGIVGDDSKIMVDMPGLEDQPEGAPRSASFIPTISFDQVEGPGEFREAETSLVENPVAKDSNPAADDTTRLVVPHESIIASGIDDSLVVENDAGIKEAQIVGADSGVEKGGWYGFCCAGEFNDEEPKAPEDENTNRAPDVVKAASGTNDDGGERILSDEDTAEPMEIVLSLMEPILEDGLSSKDNPIVQNAPGDDNSPVEFSEVKGKSVATSCLFSVLCLPDADDGTTIAKSEEIPTVGNDVVTAADAHANLCRQVVDTIAHETNEPTDKDIAQDIQDISQEKARAMSDKSTEHDTDQPLTSNDEVVDCADNVPLGAAKVEELNFTTRSEDKLALDLDEKTQTAAILEENIALRTDSQPETSSVGAASGVEHSSPAVKEESSVDVKVADASGVDKSDAVAGEVDASDVAHDAKEAARDGKDTILDKSTGHGTARQPPTSSMFACFGVEQYEAEFQEEDVADGCVEADGVDTLDTLAGEVDATDVTHGTGTKATAVDEEDSMLDENTGQETARQHTSSSMPACFGGEQCGTEFQENIAKGTTEADGASASGVYQPDAVAGEVEVTNVAYDTKETAVEVEDTILEENTDQETARQPTSSSIFACFGGERETEFQEEDVANEAGEADVAGASGVDKPDAVVGEVDATDVTHDTKVTAVEEEDANMEITEQETARQPTSLSIFACFGGEPFGDKGHEEDVANEAGEADGAGASGVDQPDAVAGDVDTTYVTHDTKEAAVEEDETMLEENTDRETARQPTSSSIFACFGVERGTEFQEEDVANEAGEADVAGASGVDKPDAVAGEVDATDVTHTTKETAVDEEDTILEEHTDQETATQPTCFSGEPYGGKGQEEDVANEAGEADGAGASGASGVEKADAVAGEVDATDVTHDTKEAAVEEEETMLEENTDQETATQPTSSSIFACFGGEPYGDQCQEQDVANEADGAGASGVDKPAGEVDVADATHDTKETAVDEKDTILEENTDQKTTEQPTSCSMFACCHGAEFQEDVSHGTAEPDAAGVSGVGKPDDQHTILDKNSEQENARQPTSWSMFAWFGNEQSGAEFQEEDVANGTAEAGGTAEAADATSTNGEVTFTQAAQGTQVQTSEDQVDTIAYACDDQEATRLQETLSFVVGFDGEQFGSGNDERLNASVEDKPLIAEAVSNQLAEVTKVQSVEGEVETILDVNYGQESPRQATEGAEVDTLRHPDETRLHLIDEMANPILDANDEQGPQTSGIFSCCGAGEETIVSEDTDEVKTTEVDGAQPSPETREELTNSKPDILLDENATEEIPRSPATLSLFACWGSERYFAEVTAETIANGDVVDVSAEEVECATPSENSNEVDTPLDANYHRALEETIGKGDIADIPGEDEPVASSAADITQPDALETQKGVSGDNAETIVDSDAKQEIESKPVTPGMFCCIEQFRDVQEEKIQDETGSTSAPESDEIQSAPHTSEASPENGKGLEEPVPQASSSSLLACLGRPEAVVDERGDMMTDGNLEDAKASLPRSVRGADTQDLLPLIDLDETMADEDERDAIVHELPTQKKKMNLGPWDLLCGDLVQDRSIEDSSADKRDKDSVQNDKTDMKCSAVHKTDMKCSAVQWNDYAEEEKKESEDEPERLTVKPSTPEMQYIMSVSEKVVQDMKGNKVFRGGPERPKLDPETAFLYAVADEIKHTLDGTFSSKGRDVPPELEYLTAFHREVEELITVKITEHGKKPKPIQNSDLPPELLAIKELVGEMPIAFSPEDAFSPEIAYLAQLARDMKHLFLYEMGPEIGFLTYAFLGPSSSLPQRQIEQAHPPSQFQIDQVVTRKKADDRQTNLIDTSMAESTHLHRHAREPMSEQTALPEPQGSNENLKTDVNEFLQVNHKPGEAVGENWQPKNELPSTSKATNGAIREDGETTGTRATSPQDTFDRPIPDKACSATPASTTCARALATHDLPCQDVDLIVFNCAGAFEFANSVSLPQETSAPRVIDKELSEETELAPETPVPIVVEKEIPEEKELAPETPLPVVVDKEIREETELASETPVPIVVDKEIPEDTKLAPETPVHIFVDKEMQEGTELALETPVPIVVDKDISEEFVLAPETSGSIGFYKETELVPSVSVVVEEEIPDETELIAIDSGGDYIYVQHQQQTTQDASTVTSTHKTSRFATTEKSPFIPDRKALSVDWHAAPRAEHLLKSSDVGRTMPISAKPSSAAQTLRKDTRSVSATDGEAETDDIQTISSLKTLYSPTDGGDVEVEIGSPTQDEAGDTFA